MPFATNGAPLRVMEMFAGVGGFRLGLEGLGTDEHPKNEAFEVVWSNQFEPSTKRRQHASEVYVARWGDSRHFAEDIFSVLADPSKVEGLLAARPDMLVGGFPCQDYSVASTSASGLMGRKGVLWWAVSDALKKLQDADQPVKYLMLENVDRLLSSPTACRGRDLAIILSSLASLGYAAEWRVVNAADYGFPQRRKRVFICGYHRSSEVYAGLQEKALGGVADWLTRHGVMARALPVQARGSVRQFDIGCDPLSAQHEYQASADGSTLFQGAGVMVNGLVSTIEVVACSTASYDTTAGMQTLGHIVSDTFDVPPQYYIEDADRARWTYLKGAKSEPRVAANGFEYRYSEGAVGYPDALDRPARTIITTEGGSAPSRFKHVIRTPDGRLRRLVPEELEALNGFPRGFTAIEGVSDSRRAFLMGNALVVGLVRRIGDGWVEVMQGTPVAPAASRSPCLAISMEDSVAAEECPS